jgi:Tol biopolymer transport system component
VRDRTAKTTTRVSVDAMGAQLADSSSVHGISDDGRYVLFTSRSTALVPGDTNGSALDVFVKDTKTGAVKRVSTKNDGTQVADDTAAWGISGDGRYVLISSLGKYTSKDNNGEPDVFVKDTVTGAVELIGVNSRGKQFASGTNFQPASMSHDGRYVAFNAAPPNKLPQVYVRDRVKKTTTLVSIDRAGKPANRASTVGAVSPDGRFVAFESGADNLVSPAPTPFFHIYVRDLRNRTTTLISATFTGAPIGQSSGEAVMSNGGVAFESAFPGTVPDAVDTTQQVYFRSL